MNQRIESREPTVRQQIIELLRIHGKMTAGSMRRYIPYRYKTIYNKALGMRAEGLIDRNAEGMWFLKVKPVEPSNTQTHRNIAPEQVQEDTLIDTPNEANWDQTDEFAQNLTNIGVDPGIASTIAEIFFCRDVYDLKWLIHVLDGYAAGFMAPHQRRLIFAWWARTRQLPYDEEDLPW